MSDSLTPLLADNRSALVTDLVGVIDAEVADQSGLSGAAVKTAYAAVQKVKPNVVHSATDVLAEDFLTALAPFWDSKPAGVSFADHLSANGDAAAEALLAVTDAQADTARPALAKAYNSLRGKAKNYVVAALPRVGATIEKHAL
ncbi:DUF6918 family protein [Gordonia paraffinivorans]|uniref:Hemerythrin-like domain-containing protein n=2 Tax=Gordonia paraffinivorans TaxID=175628 RepID=A0ABQ0IGU9_9ACTN|nr:hypothetical protein [Gordonia paraffinivorans]MBY4575324.1 hypothetical protein [Gordonia paraffinivorans]MCD2145691.1 hypothetical protein [Gordonia paraffinivorans]PWD43408.1 hypothetical protein ACN93_09220 [Gordonia paraffinivorans]VFA89641.1 Uncharacterised protein [Gordonia paraffinivorans]GAC82727.1 hypothetical protein GP2_004_00440 [Gordonia paraffinivorans NBRC 108238]